MFHMEPQELSASVISTILYLIINFMHRRQLRKRLDSHKPEAFTVHDCCWFDIQAAFKSSKSFWEILDALFCWRFAPRRFFTSFNSSSMRFTASSSVEDSHDALSSTVDCASTAVIIPAIVVATNAKWNFLHILINCYWHNNYRRPILRSSVWCSGVSQRDVVCHTTTQESLSTCA